MVFLLSNIKTGNMKLFSSLIVSLLSFVCSGQVKFSQLDENKKVVNIIVVDSVNCKINGLYSEVAGMSYLKALYGQSTVWLNAGNAAKKNPGCMGCTYDLVKDCFYYPKPSAGTYTLNPTTCKWDSSGKVQTQSQSK